jgi:hypothetical protein
MIPLWGCLKFRKYNPGKITKYGVLVRMMCEAASGYICNMEIYSAEGKKLKDTVLSLLDRNFDQNHHISQDNFYIFEISSNITRQKCESVWHYEG